MYFHYDKILDASEICNLSSEKNKILQCIRANKNLVIYGRRNIGKTSILKQNIIPSYLQSNENAFVMFADLLGVKTLRQIETRLYSAFRHGFSKSNPKESLLKKIFESVKHMRPVMTIDPVAGPSFTLAIAGDHSAPDLQSLFETVAQLSKSVPILIVLDEFQDIHFVDEAPGILRNCFQNLSGNRSIIVSGSKKHILATMFGRSRAPFSGFGEDLEFEDIPYGEYTFYMNERFRRLHKTIDDETSRYLQDLLYRIPEAINIVCDEITELDEKKIISKNMVIEALARVLDKRQGRFEETLSQFNETEERVLTIIAQCDGIEKPAGKDFVAKCALSPRGVKKVLDKLFNAAELYHWNKRIILAEPLLHHYLRSYR